MANPTNRRISLQPVFEPFELFDNESLMQPLATNGYHSDTSDDEGNLFDGLHCEANESANGTAANGSSSNGSSANGTPTNGTPTNGTPMNATAMNGELVNGAAASHARLLIGNANIELATAINGALNGAEHHPAEQIADELDPSDLSDLAAAHAAFAEDQSAPPAADSAAADDRAVGQNGDAFSNGDVHLNGDVQQPSAPHADVPPAHAIHESNGAAAAYQPDTSVEIVPQAAMPDTPPVVGDVPVEQAVEPSSNGAPIEEPAAIAHEPHPASGSMFAPYLVTEIRELRARKHRRRSWWRRMFG